MSRTRRRLLPSLLLAGAALSLTLQAIGPAAWAARASGGHIALVTIDGSINPASADYLIQAIDRAETVGAAAVLVELDTPGGLVTSTKDILKAMLGAKVPIIVYVSPAGAWAASAGTYITYAAHVAAMAPSTSIGAAHPVGIGGSEGPPVMPPGPQEPGSGDPGGEGEGEQPSSPLPVSRDYSMEKAENLLAAYMEAIAKERNRNVEWVVDAVRNSVAVGEQEALELNVIDLVAVNRTELLLACDGREVEIDGVPRVLDLSSAPIVPVEMTILQKLFSFLAEPDVAVILFLAGLLGLYIEVNNFGVVVPGVVGIVCIALALVAFQILPFSWVGLLLMLLGIGFFVAEVFVTSFGALFTAGVVCFLLGGTMLFDRPEESDLTVSFWSVLVPAVAAVAVFGGLVVALVGRSMLRPQAFGDSELVGHLGRVETPLAPDGKILIRGEIWNASSDEELAVGEPVEVVQAEGMKLRVRRAPPG